MIIQFKPEEAEAAKTELFNRAWTDDAFAARLESDPKAVLAELGGQVGDDVEVRVVRDTEKVKYVHIPAAPFEGEVSDKDLVQIQGGLTFVTTTQPLNPNSSFGACITLVPQA